MGRKRSHPFTLLSANIVGLKAGKSRFKRSNLRWITTSILCPTCLSLQQTSPSMCYGCVSECKRARSAAQAFFKLLLMSHFVTSYWPKQITVHSKVRVEYSAKLCGKDKNMEEVKNWKYL